MSATELPPADHFAGRLGLQMRHEGHQTIGEARITPEMWAKGTRRVRLGLLFTMADIVGGSPPEGALTPTVDLRFQLLAPAPTEGDIRIVAQPIKAGRTLWVGEASLFGPHLFARCEYAFMNRHFVPDGGQPRGIADRTHNPLTGSTFDDYFQMRFLEGGAVEMHAHEGVRNGVVGTIQGGAQATMAEIAAERALAGRGDYTARDIHLRYLNPLKVGPGVARPEVLPGEGPDAVVRVTLNDSGASDAIVSSALVVCRAGPG